MESLGSWQQISAFNVFALASCSCRSPFPLQSCWHRDLQFVFFVLVAKVQNVNLPTPSLTEWSCKSVSKLRGGKAWTLCRRKTRFYATQAAKRAVAQWGLYSWLLRITPENFSEIQIYTSQNYTWIVRTSGYPVTIWILLRITCLTLKTSEYVVVRIAPRYNSKLHLDITQNHMSNS